MKKTWKRILTVLLTGSTMLSLAACGTGNSTATTAVKTTAATTKAAVTGTAEKPKASGKKLRVGTMANSLGLPVHQADIAGYFKAAGLDVDIQIFATGAPINEAMAAGSLDVAVSGMASVYGLATGMYTYVGDGVITKGGEAIYARADSKIAKAGKNTKGIIGSAETVKGCSILGPLATTAHYQAINYVQSFGLKTEDFSMVSMDYAQAYQAFISGQGDLVAEKMPYTNQLQEAGYVCVCDMNLVNSNPIVDTIFVQNAIAKDRKNDVELFLDCYYRACADLMKDEANRRKVAQAWYADEGIKYSQSDMDSEVSVKDYYTLETVDTKSGLGSFMIDIGKFFNTQNMISNEDLPKVEKSIDKSFLQDVKKWSGK